MFPHLPIEIREYDDHAHCAHVVELSHLAWNSQMYYAKFSISFEQIAQMPADLLQHYKNSYIAEAMHKIEAMVPPEPKMSNHNHGSAFDINNVKFTSAYLSDEELAMEKKSVAEMMKAIYEPLLKQQFSDAETLKMMGFDPPVDTYREKAASEFEGVEDLDDSLWRDFDGLT